MQNTELNALALLEAPGRSTDDKPADTTSAPSLPDAASNLAKLAAEINVKVAAAEAGVASAVTFALEAGAMLQQAKSQIPHGKWNKWLLENCKVAPRTAQAYMRLASKVPMLPISKAQRVADLPMREAMKAIAASPETPHRCRNSRDKKKDDDPAMAVLKKTETALREAAHQIKMTFELDCPTIEELKKKLNASIEALDRVAGAA